MMSKDRPGNSNPNDDRDIVDRVSAWYGEAQPAPESRHQAIEQIVHSAASARTRTGDAIRWVRWPALAAAAALLLWLGFASSVRDGSRGVAGISFEFQMSEPEAQQVTLAGDFNGWNPRSTPMQRDRQSGLWRVSLTLPPGRHLYSYVVNGRQWVIDSLAPSVDLGELGAANVLALVESAR